MNKRKIGYTTGVYDMFHIGHLNIIERAKAQCDYLIVGVSTDKLVEHEKNKTPVIPFEERMKIVSSIRYVDEVVPQTDNDKFAAWERFHFDKMFVDSDWKGTHQWNKFEEQFKPLGVEIVYLPHTDGICSTDLSAFIKEKLEISKGGGKIGYTTGVFDMFHIGHLNIIERAKELCDYLIVGVSTDELVEEYKHKKPLVPFVERVTIVNAMSCVDVVVSQTSMDKLMAWENIRFDVMFHGDEWKGTELYNKYEQEFAKVGVHIIYLPHTEGISSSLLRDKINKM